MPKYHNTKKQKAEALLNRITADKFTDLAVRACDTFGSDPDLPELTEKQKKAIRKSFGVFLNSWVEHDLEMFLAPYINKKK